MPYIDTFERGTTPYCGMLENGYEVGIQFNAGAPFSKFYYIAPNLGRPSCKVTVSLFKMLDDYTKTVNSRPVAENTFDFADGFMMTLECPNTPMGEYLVIAHGGEFGMGFCARLEGIANIQFWENGIKCDGTLEAAIEFDNDSDCYFLPVTSNVSEQTFVYNAMEPEINVDTSLFGMVDGLGRKAPMNVDKNDKKKREVGVFYWDWSYNFCRSEGINLQKLMERHPEAKNEYYSTLWMRHNAEVYHWNEPVYGFYNCCDNYVIRRQAQALSDAGVDFIVLDCTNGAFIWKKGYEALFQGFEEAKAHGVNVPKIVFMLNFAPFRSTWIMARQLYTDIYKKGRYSDLWYYRDGKPLLICYTEILKSGNQIDNEILDFFSFRKNDPLYFTKEPESDDEWGWLSVYPQAKYGKTKNGKPEQMTVGVAQNASENGLVPMNDERGGVFGRSYTHNPDYSYEYERNGVTFKASKKLEHSKLYGLNFQEQWDHAIENDPDIIFVTGYNEWVAGRHENWQNSRNAFPDEYNDEYSRDIEPTKGDLKDHYYNQLVHNIRKYKGISVKSLAKKKTVTEISDWYDVKGINYYTDTAPVRAHSGYGKAYYTDNSRRNNICEMKTAFDDDNVYFYARCTEKITDFSDMWMNLFIHTDDSQPMWENFNYVINRKKKGSVEICRNMWEWEEIGRCSVEVINDTVTVTVPREIIGRTENISLDYKWADNSCSEGDILDFYTVGCVAPGERFTVPVRENE